VKDNHEEADDNAQVAIAQIAAYRLTKKEVYLERAKGVVKFLHQGWDDCRGGVRWHMRTSGPPFTDRNTCSTVLTAVACLRLAQLEAIDEGLRQNCILFAEKAVFWTIKELKNDQCLIMDGFSERNGRFTLNRTTYTYNTGMTITALSLIHSMKPSDQIRALALELATAAIDRSKGLFDLSVQDMDLRYWWDTTFFTQLLVEGLLIFLNVFGQDIDPRLAGRITSEVRREMKYVIDYLRDGCDNL
jgi:predicted alpha-1,6-mannanase (GH76 family)